MDKNNSKTNKIKKIFMSFIKQNIYTYLFFAVLDFALYSKHVRFAMPSMWFLFVKPRVCIRLPSDSTSRWTPLPSANRSYCQACSGLSPPSYCPCRAHYKKATKSFLLIAFLKIPIPSICHKYSFSCILLILLSLNEMI